MLPKKPLFSIINDMYKTLFSELFIDRPENDRNAIHLFVSEPSPLEEKNLGRIFVLMELEDPQPYYDEIIEKIDQAFLNAYYRSSDFEIEAAFERSLHKINKTVQELVSKYGEGWVYKTNALLGIVKDTEVHLTYVGSVEGFLIHKSTIIDILQKTQSSQIKPLKLFTNIISGQCPDQATMVFATTNLLDYLSLEKIRRTITEYDSQSKQSVFANILDESTTLSNIAALALRVETKTYEASDVERLDREIEFTDIDEIEREEFPQDNPDSMSKLIEQEQRTGDLLTPSIWPSLKKRFQNVSQNTVPSNNDTIRVSNQKYQQAGKTAVTILITIWNVAKTIIIKLVMGLAYLTKQLVRLLRNNKNVPIKIGSSVGQAGNWFQRLSRPRKVLLFSAIVVMSFFIISVLWKDRHVEQQQQIETYDQTVRDIQNLLGEIESKQIMNDEAGAKDNLAKAEQLLTSIPKESATYQSQGNALEQQITNLKNTFNKVTVITDAEEIGDFNSADAPSTLKNITKIGSNIFAFDQQSESVYRLNLETKAANAVLTGSDTEAGYETIENDSAATTLAVLKNKSFVEFNPVIEKTSVVSVDTLPDETVTDVDIFNDRLYVLDASAGKIYRHNASGDAYGKSSEWLSNGVSVAGAVAFDIDSSIYVLMSDGAVKKYDSGSEVKFQLDAVQPGLGGATRIIKPSVTSSFYILNPQYSMISIFKPDGKLDKQLTTDQFKDLKDIVVDLDSGSMYVLAGSKIYQVKL